MAEFADLLAARKNKPPPGEFASLLANRKKESTDTGKGEQTTDPTPLRTMAADSTMALGGAAANVISSGVAEIAGGVTGLTAGLVSMGGDLIDYAAGEEKPFDDFEGFKAGLSESAAFGEDMRSGVAKRLTIPAGEGGERLLANIGQTVSENIPREIKPGFDAIFGGVKGLESEILEKFGPEVATVIKTLPVAAFEIVAARMGMGPIKKAGEKVAKGMDEAVFNYQTPAKKRAAELLRAGSVDEKDVSGFKLVPEPKLPEGTPRPAPRVRTDTYAQAAEAQGFDPGVISPMKAGTAQDKANFLEMTNIMEGAKNNRIAYYGRRPSDVIGDSVMKRYDLVKKANKAAGNEIDKVAEGLKGKPIDIDNASDNFSKALDEFGIQLVEDKKGGFKADFEMSTLGPGDRGPIKEVVRQMNLRRGNVDALSAHEMKQAIDRSVTFGKKKTALSRDASEMLKNFRRDIDKSLDSTYAEYDNANIAYSETIEALNDFQDVAGGLIDLSAPGANKAVGTLMRGELSQIKSRAKLTNARVGLERMAEKYEFYRGTDSRLIEGPPKPSVLNDSIIKQIIYADELDRRFGSLATAGFEGSLTKAGKTVARGGIKEAVIDAGLSAADKLLRKSDKKAYQAMRNLLKE